MASAINPVGVNDYLPYPNAPQGPGGPVSGFYNTPFGQAIDPWGFGRNVIAPIGDSFMRPIQAAQNFFSPNPADTIGATGFTPQEEIQFAQDAANLGISPDIVRSWIGAVRSGQVDKAYVLDQLTGARSQHEQFQNLDATYKGTIDRLGRLVGDSDLGYIGDPNAVRTDAEYGTQLSEAENRLRAFSDQQQRSSRQMAANAGGQSLSGRAEQLQLGADAERARGLGDAYAGVAGDILTRKDILKSEYGDKRSAILDSWKPSTIDPYETGVGYRAYSSGQQDQGVGRGIDLGLSLAGIGGNLLTGASNTISRLWSAIPGKAGSFLRATG